MASCADDADLRITNIIRGQDHLTNSFKHILIFEALGLTPPAMAHLPLLIAPDGAKLSKRKHGPVVSVTTYRDAGFLPQAYINFLCLLGWSPKDDREVMSRDELMAAFSLEGVNRSNAVVNFTEADPIDPKALWLNGQHIRALPVDQLAELLIPEAQAAGWEATPERMRQVTPLIRERIHTLRDFAMQADIFFVKDLAPYDAAELIPQKGDAAMAKAALESASQILAQVEFSHDPLKAALEAGAAALKVKNGQLYQPIRVAVCGRKNAPPLFETLEVMGRQACLNRIAKALDLLPTS
jgi:glutamyl-tRNA synthetase